MSEFYCTNCKKKLPEYFTIAKFEKGEGLKEYKCITMEEYKYVDNKINILILRSQGINVTCPHCNEETYPATIYEIMQQKKVTDSVCCAFDKYVNAKNK